MSISTLCGLVLLASTASAQDHRWSVRENSTQTIYTERDETGRHLEEGTSSIKGSLVEACVSIQAQYAEGLSVSVTLPDGSNLDMNPKRQSRERLIAAEQEDQISVCFETPSHEILYTIDGSCQGGTAFFLVNIMKEIQGYTK